MSKIERPKMPERSRPRFPPRGGVPAGRAGSARANASREAERFIAEHDVAGALYLARGVAESVFGDAAVVSEPELRSEVLGDASNLFVAVEVPPMDEGDFIRRYDAFMDGVWGEIDLDPALVTFSVQTRASD
jgi:hypothetical protein